MSVPDWWWAWVKCPAGEESAAREHAARAHSEFWPPPQSGLLPTYVCGLVNREVTGPLAWPHSWILGGFAGISGISHHGDFFTWHQKWLWSISWRLLWKWISDPAQCTALHAGPHLCCWGGRPVPDLPLPSVLQADVAGQLGIVSNNQGAALKGRGLSVLVLSLACLRKPSGQRKFAFNLGKRTLFCLNFV